MSDAAYGLAIRMATIGDAARVGTSRRLLAAAIQAHAMAALMRQSPRLKSGLARAALPPLGMSGAPQSGVGDHSAVHRGRQATAAQTMAARAAGTPRARSLLPGACTMLFAGPGSAAMALPAIRSAPGGGPGTAGAGSSPARPRVSTMALPRRPDASFAAVTAVQRRLLESLDPRLAAQAGSARSMAVSGAGERSRGGAPSLRQHAAPGFHRTVRAPQGRAAAGDVYLDKALVGYHLAAVVTAEQTRAAGRPDMSGSSFNSSMAALRPSGAGS